MGTWDTVDICHISCKWIMTCYASSNSPLVMVPLVTSPQMRNRTLIPAARPRTETEECTYQWGPAPGGLASDWGWRIWLSIWKIKNENHHYCWLKFKRSDRQGKLGRGPGQTSEAYLTTHAEHTAHTAHDCTPTLRTHSTHSSWPHTNTNNTALPLFSFTLKMFGIHIFVELCSLLLERGLLLKKYYGRNKDRKTSHRVNF